ncbi:transposase, partial [Enterococcus hirae]
KDKGGFIRDFKIYECEDRRNCPVHRQCTRAKSEQKRKIQVNNNWRYFKAECRKKLLEEKTGSIYRKRKIDVEPVFGHLKAHLDFPHFFQIKCHEYQAKLQKYLQNEQNRWPFPILVNYFLLHSYDQ